MQTTGRQGVIPLLLTQVHALWHATGLQPHDWLLICKVGLAYLVVAYVVRAYIVIVYLVMAGYSSSAMSNLPFAACRISRPMAAAKKHGTMLPT